MAPAIFKNMVLATAGPLPGQFTEDNLATWIKQRKGQFVKDMNQSVTHLLCTDEQYKARKKIKRIKEAQQKGSRIRVVHYDWFEFSCNRNKKLPEKEYYFDNLLAEERAKRRKQLARSKSQRNLAIGEHWINPDNFGTCEEKYVLYLFQSFAKPTLYWFGVKYYKKDDGKRWMLKAINRPSPCSRPFYTEFDKFKDFFRLKTGIAWHERITKAGTTESTYFQYTPPTGGKPVGKGLTRGRTHEDCLELNHQLRRMHNDLFGDTQTSSDKNPSMIEGPKTQDPAQGCEQNSHYSTSDVTDVGTMNQDTAEQELLELLKDKGIEEALDRTLYSVAQHHQSTYSGYHNEARSPDKTKLEIPQPGDAPLFKLDQLLADKNLATHSSFNMVESFRSLSVPTFDEAVAGTDAAQAQLIQESIDQAAKDANGEEGQQQAASDKSKAIDVLLKAANASQGVRDILSKTEFARIIGELDDFPIEQAKARDFSQDQEPVKSRTIVEPDYLEIPSDDVEENPLSRVKLQPCDRARIREAFEHMTWSQKRKRDTGKDMAAFRTPESAGTFMGAGEVRVVTKRVKKAAKHKSEARHITKAMRETAGAEITQEGTLRPLSEEQVAHIFSQPIPQPGGKIPSSRTISMELSLDDVSGMVDEMFGVSKFDDGSDLMTEMHGERPWPAGHNPASPEDDPAHTNEPVEDFDTRAPSFKDMSAKTAAHGSSGIEMHCFVDQETGEHRSGISMVLSNNESSADDDYVLSQGLNTAMQTDVSPADEASNLIQYRQSAPRTEACFAPFAEEELMFQSSDLHPNVSAHFKPKTN
ncbi:predicted protein [Verticillium alfalfae VaMs.102]|uniref:Predicted protein n=1 Tax=Verticillium alfalfae (strain VaMs.102 / ATCC MYA-4576 / FGSC 10136) TaxID=526221 RepID=C9SP57_VERA1|nr:predicted protein [Verticillium alfalfae VaMs.102]EEY20572.1 predicted protein [Verticillium alfalfae VaMs.102]